MVLVAPAVCRYAFNGEYLGRPAVNLLDMVVLEGDGPSEGRATDLQTVAQVLIDNWVALITGLIGTAYTCNTLSWVDLATADGPTGETTLGNDETLPASGEAGGDSISANTALLVTKQTNSGRGSRKGRWFLAGAVEPQLSGNLLSPAFVEGGQDLLDTFLEDSTETGVLAALNYFPTVVHTRNVGTPEAPVIEYVNNTQIQELTLERQVASQRRRNRP